MFPSIYHSLNHQHDYFPAEQCLTVSHVMPFEIIACKSESEKWVQSLFQVFYNLLFNSYMIQEKSLFLPS